MSKAVPLRVDALSTHHNALGFRGIEQVKPGRYRAKLGGGDHPWRSKYFDTPREAARAYDRQARKVYGARGFYNFPRPGSGEKRVRPADPDQCCRGHERESNTYFAPDGRAGYCRKCNREAQVRSKARRKARGERYGTESSP
jgi:hypothetical protein